MDEIDRIIAHTLSSLGIRSDYYGHKEIAAAIRDALTRGNFVIVPSTDALLRKGTEVAGGGKVR